MTSTRIYDTDGRWTGLDNRHGIAREGTGNPRSPWVFRFCGEWIGSYPTKTAATKAALQWEVERVGRMLRA